MECQPYSYDIGTIEKIELFFETFQTTGHHIYFMVHGSEGSDFKLRSFRMVGAFFKSAGINVMKKMVV